ncbi:MAG: hypothetical protein BWY45_00696 [Euryarchaeota archaeon ADurb.Bin294]|jgi:hypothetical protein|nr:MAG: hypothetical protein BWY45_00696 [Euryarchaeota archaeon ADurb.Bin294]
MEAGQADREDVSSAMRAILSGTLRRINEVYPNIVTFCDLEGLY